MAKREPPAAVRELMAIVRQLEEQSAAEPQNPLKLEAALLVQAGEELFWQKAYDRGIQKLEEAAKLDPEYLGKLEAYRKLKIRELRKGRVNLTRAVNRILVPRLQRLGWHPRGEETGAKWKEGSILVCEMHAGLEAFVLMGQSKFGKQFGLNVGRTRADGKVEYLDLRTVGLGREMLRYLNQAEAEAVLERVAVAFESAIQRWCEGRP
jgi:hypothetical protein